MLDYKAPDINDNKLNLSKLVYFIYMNVSEASITDVYFYPDKSIHIDVVYGGNDDFVVIDKNGLVIIDNSFFHDFINDLMVNKTIINCDIINFLIWAIDNRCSIDVTEKGLRVSF